MQIVLENTQIGHSKECPPPGTSAHARFCACWSSAQWPPSPHWRARRSASTHAGYWQAETAATSAKTTMMILVIGADSELDDKYPEIHLRERHCGIVIVAGAVEAGDARIRLDPP